MSTQSYTPASPAGPAGDLSPRSTPSMPREWNARSYDALPLPHTGWGVRVLHQVPLRGDEHVLDAGAGTGRDAVALLERLPDGRVLAVDASHRMLEVLAEKVADPRLEVRHHDLTTPLVVNSPLDACISVATFHWIEDHDALFQNIGQVLRPGAVFVAECGGEGNVARVDAAVADVVGGVPDGAVWHFAGVEETRDQLAAAGFEDIEVGLRPDPAHLRAGEQFEAFLATVILGGHLAKMDADRHEDFVTAVADRIGEPVVDYVRLELRARKAP